MLRPVVWLLVLAACLAELAGPLSADWCPTELAFPGWQVSTCEDAYANDELSGGLRRYPISNLLDGDITTAWVFEGPKWDGIRDEYGYVARPGHAFQGGVGQWIEICSLSNTPPLVDAVGLTNGYAKDASTYLRNNRITRISLQASDARGRRLWQQTADLKPVMWMQVIPIPETPADRITLTVEQVDSGHDNDLCISEIQLYYKGRAVIQKPPPYVLYSPGDECGCGWTAYLVDLRGRPRALAERTEDWWAPAYSFPPNGRLVAITLVTDTGDSLVVADLTTGRTVLRTSDPGQITAADWITNTKLRLTTRSDDTSATREIDVSRSRSR
jgi:hypothetical protein